MRKLALAAAALAAVAAASMATPAQAITRGGSLDGNDHPYVGLMTATDGVSGWRCSGALVSPTVYVTAGHCTYDAQQVWLWFDTDLEPNPADFGYPFSSPLTGTAYGHPQYNDDAFFLYDVGVVVLDTPVILDEYATLPGLGAADALETGRKNPAATVTAVGYGLQKIVGSAQGKGQDFVLDAKTRYQADLMVVDTTGVAGIGAINPGQSFTMSGDSKHGGTCFGDSGGPILQAGTNVILGVNSFGLNGNCAGIGGAYRVDQQDDLDFLLPFLG